MEKEPEKIPSAKANNTGRTSVSALTVMSFTLLSRLLGFIRAKVISNLFGLGPQADALNAVFNIPNNLRRLMAEGALSSAFIPILSTKLEKEPNNDGAKRFTRTILGFQLSVLIPFVLLCIVFAGILMNGFLVNWTGSDAQLKYEISVPLFRLLFGYILLVSISAILMAVLNSNGKFAVPAATPVLFSVCVISSLLLFGKSMGVYAMVIGVAAGGIAQILFQLPMFFKLKYSIVPLFSFKDPEFKLFLKNWGPILLTSSLFSLNNLIANQLASSLEHTGSVSALSYALLFFQLPFGIFYASITTVTFPKLSRAIAANDMDLVRTTINYGIRFLVTTLIPSIVILSLLSKEIIGTVYLGDKIQLDDISLISSVLIGYTIGLLFMGIYQFLQRYFYASNKNGILVKLGFVILVTDVAFSIVLMRTRLGVAGIALANSIAFTVGLIMLLVILLKDIKSIDSKSILVTGIKVIVSLIPAVGIIYASKLLLPVWWHTGLTIRNVLLLAGLGIILMLVTLAMFYVFKLTIVTDVLSRRGHGKSAMSTKKNQNS